MKSPLLIAALLLMYIARTQAQTCKYYPAFQLMAGQKLFTHPNLNNQVNSFNRLKLFGPVTQVGIGYSEHGSLLIGAYAYSHPDLYYTQVLPQRIQLNDSLSGNMTGFTFGTSFSIIDFFRHHPSLSLIVGAGFNTGRLRISGNDVIKQKNPFFAPKLSLSPRVWLGRFNLALLLEMEWDVSSKAWRKTRSSSRSALLLPSTSSTGANVMLSLGYSLYKAKKARRKTTAPTQGRAVD